MSIHMVTVLLLNTKPPINYRHENRRLGLDIAYDADCVLFVKMLIKTKGSIVCGPLTPMPVSHNILKILIQTQLLSNLLDTHCTDIMHTQVSTSYIMHTL